MHFFIKHKDLNILKFVLIHNFADLGLQIEWINEDFREFLPLDLELTNDGVAKWLKHRTIPRNRTHANNFLSKCGLSINRPMDIISVSKGLSLNDVYWVVEEGFDGCFDRYNPYENNFSQILALIDLLVTVVLLEVLLHHVLSLQQMVICLNVGEENQERYTFIRVELLGLQILVMNLIPNTMHLRLQRQWV